jgi:hypothetical protein
VICLTALKKIGRMRKLSIMNISGLSIQEQFLGPSSYSAGGLEMLDLGNQRISLLMAPNFLPEEVVVSSAVSSQDLMTKQSSYGAETRRGFGEHNTLSGKKRLRMLHQGPSKKREEALKLLQANRYNWRLYLTMEEICHPKLTQQPHRFRLAPKHFTSAWSILHCLKALQLYAKPYKLTPKSWTTIMSRK